MRKPLIVLAQSLVTNTTCRDAVDKGHEVGARVFWRPGGVVNWTLPELDRAQVLED
jgi:hypothetical protein